MPSDDRPSAFTFLRLVLALAVVFGHSYILGGFGEEPLARLGGMRAAGRTLAVQAFFVLSGYLLTRSLAVEPSLRRYAVRRCFRILPGYWVALLVTGVVIAPVMLAVQTTGRVGYDLPAAAVHDYVVENALLYHAQRNIPPLFEGNRFPNLVNGSLWTLFYEALCYAFLALAHASGALQRRWPMVALFLVLFALQIHCFLQPIPFFTPTSLSGIVLNAWVHPLGVNLLLAFLAGVTAAVLVGERTLRSVTLVAASVVILAIALPRGAIQVAWPIAIPGLLLGLGHLLPFQRLDAIGDVSYGVYIYGFVIQQSLSLLGVPKLGQPLYLVLSVLVSLTAGAISWVLVERPAIAFGKSIVRRWERSASPC